MKKRQNITTGVLLLATIVVVINIFSFFYFFRLDFTNDRRYTLSDATKNILDSLTKPVTITAYYTENSIPAIARCRSDLKDILTEYASISGNKVVYNFVNPNKSDSSEAVAIHNGVKSFPVQMREKDEMKSVKVYMGAVVKMGDKTDVLPLVDPNASLEYVISNSIKKLSIDKRPFLGLLQGNGEPAIEDMQQVDQSVSSLHVFKTLPLADGMDIPKEYNTLALVDPVDTFRPAQLKVLDDFLARGGRLLITYSGLNADLRNGIGRVAKLGLTKWLAEKGIILGDKFITDAHCGSISVPQSMGGMQFNSKVPFPFLPMITNFSDHPVTKNLRSIMFPFASDIKFTGDTNAVKFKPLAFTSDETGLKQPPLKFDINYKWQKEEFPLSNLIVAAAISGIGNKDSRIIIISNGQFAVNGQGDGTGKQAPPKLEQDNIDLFSNAVDWLSDNTGLIDLRSKVIKFSPIKDISDGEKLFLKSLNFSIPLLLVIFYGITRMQVKKRIRTKRMEEII